MDKVEWKNVDDEVAHYSVGNEWICPYCGHVYKMDYTEFIPNELEFETDFDCPKCGKTYIVSQSVSFSYQTYKSR